MNESILKGLGIDKAELEKLGDNPTEEQVQAFTGNVVNSWKSAAYNDPEHKQKLNAEALGAVMGSLRSQLKKNGIEGEIKTLQDVGSVINTFAVSKANEGSEELATNFNALQSKFAEVNENYTQAQSKIEELQSSIPSLEKAAYEKVESKYHILARLDKLAQEKKIAPVHFESIYGSIEAQFQGKKIARSENGFVVKQSDGSDVYDNNKKLGVDDLLLGISEKFGLRIMSDPKGAEPQRKSQESGENGVNMNFPGMKKIHGK
jgi:DNA repair exonuclease SbcCD ATPase subunit